MLVLECKAVVKPSQSKAIDEAIRTSQFVRNKVLRYWIDNRGIGKKQLYQYNTQLRAEYAFVKDLNSHACQASVENVERAINRFFDNCKKNKPGKKGYPRFKKDARSVEYKTSGWKLHPTKRRITFLDKKGIGELKLLGKWDIHTYPVDLIKRVRIVRRESSGYYVQFCVKVDAATESRIGDGELGLDVGLEYFYSDSNGHHEENPRFLRKAEKSIKHAQRCIYRKEKGKNNRRKARGRYQRKHLRVSTIQREEHAKRIARNVCKANAFVAYEDLNVKGLVRNRRLAKSISDVAWSAFRRWLEYFARKVNTEVVAVAPHYTSQKCSSCGNVVKKGLSTRTHICKCGCVLQRDVNAAINILSKAKSTGGHLGSNAWGVATSTLLGASQAHASCDVEPRIPLHGRHGECQIESQNHRYMNIGILGLGLIGGSLGLDLRSQGHHVLGVSRRESTCDKAVALGSVDQASVDMSLLTEAEVVFICTPIGLIIPTFEQLMAHLPSNTVITDVGSVKTPIVQAIAPLWDNFIGGHPMAGRTDSGIEAAIPNLFENKPYVLTPTQTTPTAAITVVEKIVRELGATLYHCSPEDHDKAVSWISHLPVMVSASLIAACMSETDSNVLELAQKFASSGFRDTSRVGGGNPELGVMMAQYNRQALLNSLQQYRHNLDELISLIEQEDWTALEQQLQSNHKVRPEFVE